MITKEAIEAAAAEIQMMHGAGATASEQAERILTAAIAAMPAQAVRQNYNCPCAHPSQCDSSCLTPAPDLASENERLRAADFRALSVEIVDCIRGYTFEFSSNPLAHKDDYDFIEEKLRTALERT